MPVPRLPDFREGTVYLEDLQDLVAYVRSITPKNGVGIRCERTPGGTSIHGLTADDKSSSGQVSERCECPDGPYEITVDCGPCGDEYGPANKMPRIWRLTVMEPDYGDANTDDCASCSGLVGMVFDLINVEDEYGEPTCVWTSTNNACYAAELTVDDDGFQITIMGPDGSCVLVIARNEAAACCGKTETWTLDEDSTCDVRLRLEPHPCTCCPAVTCPEDEDETVCDDTDCCVHDCVLNITIAQLATIPSSPLPPPEESCGGMNGVIAVKWVSNCTWYFEGVPSGVGSTSVKATLTLSKRIWRLELLGENGQTAMFTKPALAPCTGDWDCERTVQLCLVDAESSCPITVMPTATFTLSLPE